MLTDELHSLEDLDAARIEYPRASVHDEATLFSPVCREIIRSKAG
jgi:hypothetical protein